MYHLPSVNMKLRPRLLSELAPGTRIVSHSFDMEDWVPERTIRVPVEGYERTVYYWVVPPRGTRK
jgi:hypothetical protein